MSYLDKTKDGYSVVSLYIKKDSWGPNGTLLAIIKRKEDWLWAYDYRPGSGTWGNGHYMFDSKAEAVADMKHDYPNAKPVKKSNLFEIESPTDSFGWYTSRAETLKRAYYLVKRRNEPMIIKATNPAYSGRVDKSNYSVITYRTHTTDYQLYADGRIKKL